MNSDQNNEECLVEQLRKELHSLKAEKERDGIKLILEKEEMEIAKKEEELKHFRARVQLRREKIQKYVIFYPLVVTLSGIVNNIDHFLVVNSHT
ncbi:unnamed protein product [Onchocerca flexuosa]|uniref:Uncharacterized protein n=1 Tax=Onchocerca flexuosa TaxID=387005 RepID=A0A183HH94_9BILA|nr:unnamed protein product [Onchocerca flexuosa]